MHYVSQLLLHIALLEPGRNDEKVALKPVDETVPSETNLTNMFRCVELYPPWTVEPEPDKASISGLLIESPLYK